MREVRDGARHAGIVEGQSGPVSDLCWRYLGVVKAGEIEAGQWNLMEGYCQGHSSPRRSRGSGALDSSHQGLGLSVVLTYT